MAKITLGVSLSVLVVVSLTGAVATADVGVSSQNPSEARPGQTVKITVACGSCNAGTRFPVSMVPVTEYPEPNPCRNDSLCGPMARNPPAENPYVLLGETNDAVRVGPGAGFVGTESSFQFKVPAVDPGRYLLVVFCAECVKGPKGSLVANRNTAQGNLRVLPDLNAVGPAAQSSGNDPKALWLLAGLALIVATLFLIRSRLPITSRH